MNNSEYALVVAHVTGKLYEISFQNLYFIPFFALCSHTSLFTLVGSRVLVLSSKSILSDFWFSASHDQRIYFKFTCFNAGLPL